ncbi:hypothetical protein [Lactococcus petauri]|nr:hypothetical protein [Lactococcus petauri]
MPSSFTQFLKKRFQNQLFDAVSDYVDENINHWTNVKYLDTK